ncbi:zinc finger protein 84-like [Culex pipiens pallens]|uniref:zinc finger protein 84-like n=1 Tax=Culex pipiens pallens TaxID=42434 RepID=UPI001953964C|nr:zinc finger protein 84-like [Culex pipiens pallens]
MEFPRSSQNDPFQQVSLSLPNPAEKSPQLDDFCRICLLRKVQLRPLATPYAGVMIPEMLYKVTGTLINMQEHLPRVICDRCLVKLDLAYSVTEEFRRQEEKLRRFWWKGGVLVDELAAYQHTEESWRKTHAEEVMDRLASGRLDPVPVALAAAVPEQPVASVDCKQLLVRKEEPEVKQEPVDASSFCIEILSDDSADEAGPETTLQDKIDNVIEMELKHDVPAAESQEELLVEQEFPEQQHEHEMDTFDAEAPPSPVESLSEHDDNDKDSDYVPDGAKDREEGPRSSSVASRTKQTEEANDASLYDYDEKLDKNATECPECGKKFGSWANLKRHHNRHVQIAKGRYKCSKCVCVFATKQEMRGHTLNHIRAEKLNYFECKFCKMPFRYRSRWIAHQRMHEIQKDPLPIPAEQQQKNEAPKVYFECRYCEMVFEWECRLKQHEAAHQKRNPDGGKDLEPKKKPTIQCQFCPRNFRKQNELDRHMLRHKDLNEPKNTDDNFYECAKCDLRYANPHHLVQHMKKHENIENGRFRCKNCDHAFGTHYELKRHMIKYERNRSESLNPFDRVPPPVTISRDDKTFFKCRECAKVFVSRPNYVQHARTHGVPKSESFHCPDCGKRYAQRINLRVHQQEAHNLFIKPEPGGDGVATLGAELHCAKCDTLFSSQESYELHMQGHLDEVPVVTADEGLSQEPTMSVADHPSDLPIIQQVTGSFFKTESHAQQTLPMEESHQIPYPVSATEPMVVEEQQPEQIPAFATVAIPVDNIPEWADDQASASGSCFSEAMLPDRSELTPSVASSSGPLDSTGYSIEILTDESDDDSEAVIELSEDDETVPSTSGDTWKCTLCDVVLIKKKKSDIQKHMLMHEKILNGTYKCEVCDKKFGESLELAKHRRLIHNLKEPHPDEDTMECKRCSRRIKKKKFSFHLSCHKNIDMRAIVCKFCDKAFGTKHHLNWHRKSKSCGQRQSDCQKQRPPTVALIQNRNTLQTPEQRQQEGRYKCTECDKSYANAQTIYLHMQKHQAMREGRFKCEVCKLACATQRHLEAHMQKHPEVSQQGAASSTE